MADLVRVWFSLRHLQVVVDCVRAGIAWLCRSLPTRANMMRVLCQVIFSEWGPLWSRVSVYNCKDFIGPAPTACHNNCTDIMQFKRGSIMLCVAVMLHATVQKPFGSALNRLPEFFQQRTMFLKPWSSASSWSMPRHSIPSLRCQGSPCSAKHAVGWQIVWRCWRPRRSQGDH